MDKLHLFRNVSGMVKKNVVMVVAMVAACITCFFVPPDKAYWDYFDVKTLTCLFCVLAVVCALKNIHFFYILAKKIVRVFKNARMSILALVYITFIGSMLIANDMALLTFLPLGLFVLSSTGKKRYMAFTFIMQNIAANLGGMLTPFGNPQNLYLYTAFHIPNLEFMKIMAPPFVVAVLLITVCCLIFVKPEPLALKEEPAVLPVNGCLPFAVCLGDRHCVPGYSLLDWVGGDSHSADLYGSQGAEDGGLSAAADLYIFLYFLREYGPDRRCPQAVFHAVGKEHPAVQCDLLPGYQQCAFG